MTLLQTSPRPQVSDWAASLAHQRRNLIGTESVPGMALYDLDNILATPSPTPAAKARALEIMVMLNLNAQDLVLRDLLRREGKLQFPETFNTI